MFTIAIFKGVPTTPFDSSRTHAWAYHGPYTTLPIETRGLMLLSSSTYLDEVLEHLFAEF